MNKMLKRFHSDVILYDSLSFTVALNLIKNVFRLLFLFTAYRKFHDSGFAFQLANRQDNSSWWKRWEHPAVKDAFDAAFAGFAP